MPRFVPKSAFLAPRAGEARSLYREYSSYDYRDALVFVSLQHLMMRSVRQTLALRIPAIVGHGEGVHSVVVPRHPRHVARERDVGSLLEVRGLLCPARQLLHEKVLFFLTSK